MIIFLALILIFLVILIGGERGAMSIMTLAGNIVILFFSIMLMSAGCTYKDFRRGLRLSLSTYEP